MRLCSFILNGRESFGIVTAGGVVDLGLRMDYPEGGLRSCIGDLSALQGFAPASADHALEDVVLLPPIPAPAKIIGIGVNYHAHLAETGTETPKNPMLFARYPDSLVGHGTPVIRPKVSTKFDFECELAVVIGKGGRAIPPEQAMDHVGGYSCFNDASIRDWQFHTSQVMAGKNFWRSGSFGPWIVTPDEFGAVGSQKIRTRLNGEQMQEAQLDDLVFGVEALIAYISAMAPLSPGDVIATGTPGGVGLFRKPRIWMKPGDHVEVEIDGIGILANTVADEA